MLDILEETTASLPWTIRNKYVLMTGATNGIGLAAAHALAKNGARLGLIARNKDKAEACAARIRLESGLSHAHIDIFIADMSSMHSVRTVAEEILEACPRIDVLINNAGAFYDRRYWSEDHVEMTWALNHLGPFLLTTLLLSRLKENVESRIIFTSSHGHKMARNGIGYGDLDGSRLYGPFKRFLGGANLRYGETKLANLLYTVELAKRLQGTGISANCFDPGLVSTGFNMNNGMLAKMTMSCMKPFSRMPEKGAETLVWLAESTELTGQSGNYYKDLKIGNPSKAAQDLSSAARLWEISEQQISHILS
ncbi:SDR family NAD(P)-dependent oxidoreductase [Paenibacillus sp. HJL G12]|uniref:SDR family NAD(P)-dependent oxidoreductase n=1 Tax=Paenibacillus dendrobii TaxID=2691084 RepID=A0A7X3IL20_9BACL|nr:SDR family NAD(P)-dependent oxidoreductase [Paenibacillus dendrobii]MWV45478.1 SDR family NAD(P)-dependent oxidoreductase [Paenibacillus dendrobii]